MYTTSYNAYTGLSQRFMRARPATVDFYCWFWGKNRPRKWRDPGDSARSPCCAPGTSDRLNDRDCGWCNRGRGTHFALKFQTVRHAIDIRTAPRQKTTPDGRHAIGAEGIAYAFRPVSKRVKHCGNKSNFFCIRVVVGTSFETKVASDLR